MNSAEAHVIHVTPRGRNSGILFAARRRLRLDPSFLDDACRPQVAHSHRGVSFPTLKCSVLKLRHPTHNASDVSCNSLVDSRSPCPRQDSFSTMVNASRHRLRSGTRAINKITLRYARTCAPTVNIVWPYTIITAATCT